MWYGKVIIVDTRLQGRFGSNTEYPIKPTKYKRLALLKTKLKAMYLDYFIYGQNKAIYFKVYREAGAQ